MEILGDYYWVIVWVKWRWLGVPYIKNKNKYAIHLKINKTPLFKWTNKEKNKQINSKVPLGSSTVHISMCVTGSH